MYSSGTGPMVSLWRVPIEGGDPAPTEFVFARWQYGRGMNGGWWHDYPAAEEHINQIMKEATGIDVDADSYKIVPISSDDVVVLVPYERRLTVRSSALRRRATAR